jgi:isocitrate dehydrogenase
MPAKPPVGTRDFIAAIVQRLGSGPRTVAAQMVPDAAAPSYQRPPKPANQQVIRTFTNTVTHIVGCDLYLDAAISPIALADEMIRAAEDTPFRLTLISNRGTQVWPTGSVYTECVDYYRVRFEIREGVRPGDFGQARTIALLDKIAEKFTIGAYELLRVFDGVKGYSLAQGQ